MRILVADDHELLRRGVRFVVGERPDWEICAEAADGSEAVDKARESKPDVAILDVSMPKLNGLEATLAIRQLSPETEVVILTQHESVEMVRHAFEAGARGYVVKSNVANELVSAIETVSHHQFFFSEKWRTSSHTILGADDGQPLGRIEIEGQAEQRTAALQKLATNLLHRQDRERQSIGQELHEAIGRDLSGIAFNLELMSRSNGHGSDPLFTESLQLVRHCVARTRALSQSLDPPLLSEIGLASASQWLVEDFHVRTGIEVRTEWVSADRLPPEVEAAFFWILNEALANVRAHSGAKFADVSIKLEAQGASLEVRDHGCGMPGHVLDRFSRGDVGSTVGLAAIRERTRELGGEMDVWSGPNGTALRARVPAAALRRLTPRARRQDPPEAEERSAACA
jgi:signal transduction histidine kinase